MAYVTLDNLDPSRLPDIIEGLNKEDIMVDCYQDGRINKVPKDKFQEHMADVTLGMLFMACKGTHLSFTIPYAYSRKTGTPTLFDISRFR